LYVILLEADMPTCLVAISNVLYNVVYFSLKLLIFWGASSSVALEHLGCISLLKNRNIKRLKCQKWQKSLSRRLLYGSSRRRKVWSICECCE